MAERTSTPRPRVVHNRAAAISSRIDQLTAGGGLGLDLTGAGVLLGSWDQGAARATHIDLRGRTSSLDAAGAADHSTHVAGTIIGSGTGQAAALGMALGARLLAFDWTFDRAELRQWAPYLVASNHAYGFQMGWATNSGCPGLPTWLGRAGEAEDRAFGKYGPEAVALDELAQEAALLMIWAGGNERQDTGAAGGQPHHHYPDCVTTFDDEHAAESEQQYDTLGLELAAKNTLVVGAVAHVMSDPASAGDIELLPFSSFGPMDDGRIKPELVASGAQIFSSVSSADDAYADFSGSSSSAAVVTGALALLTELQRELNDGVDLRAEAMKALLIHSAVAQGALGAPTYEAGFGLLDARAAAELLQADASSLDGRHLRLGRVESEHGVELTTSTSLPAGTPMRATLVWIDPPAPVNANGVDDRRRALVNDLDLALIAPDGTVFHPWSLDRVVPEAPATRSAANRVDTVEVVDVAASENSATGSWAVRVSAATLERGRAQSFSLVASVPLPAFAGPLLATPRSIIASAAAGASPAPVRIAMRNAGSSELAWTASSTVPWLAVGKAAGSAPDTMEISFDARALATGDHFATVALDSDDPSGPRTLGVMLRVTCTPDCAGRSCGRDPACGESCGGCASSEACDDSGQCQLWGAGCPAADLGSTLGNLVLDGNSQGAGNLRTGSCGGADGPDLAFAWTAPAPGSYRFGTDGSAIDTVLYLRDDCDGAELACNDDSDDATSAVAVTLDAGQAVVVVVDSRQSAGGNVHLAIEPAVCPDAALGSRLGSELVTADLAGALDRLSGSCGGAGTPEAAFSWIAPSAGDYLLSATAT
ncbi:MAG TPA: S8 family serine peptidase, partial [Polyangiales bacterium]|nr:S8 family serine peptidase [Polyangiales bacterium]